MNIESGASDAYGTEWVLSRAGGRSVRGYYFQDVVGAWLAAKILNRELCIGQMVPEGHEDLSCDGGDAWQVQVKSRQGHRGDFSASEVAKILLGVWGKHRRRLDGGLESRPVLVLERPVAGACPQTWGEPIAAAFDDFHPLISELRSHGSETQMDLGEVDQLIHECSVVVLPWHQARSQAVAAVAGRTELPYGLAVPVVQALRGRVQDCTAANAAVTDPRDRHGLGITDIDYITNSIIELIDREALETALRERLCEPIDFDTPRHDDAFFEGIAVQPGHIAAGLPAPRPAPTGRVLDGLERGRPVLVTGPSGVGKSMVMWAAGYSARHVLWYRIRSLRQQDIRPLIDLVRASGPTEATPVGFIVDGVGTGSMREWDTLVERLASIPGAMLLGSARTEDLLPLRTLPSCQRVEVELDEEVAARIHRELLDSHQTTESHWREAFESADGLTLEFTYLLTQGDHLADVVSEQVHKRVVEGRDDELQLLALASVAHQWNASISAQSAIESLGSTMSASRQALQRLQDEHLLHVEDGQLTGRHPVRSRALADAVHRTPPPFLAQTVESIIGLLEDVQLAGFVAAALAENESLDEPVLAALADRLASNNSLNSYAAVLQALRAGGFQRQLRSWVETMDQHGVAPADRITTSLFVLANTEPTELFKPEIVAAVSAMQNLTHEESSLRNRLLERIGLEQVSDALWSCQDPASATFLLSMLEGLPENHRDYLLGRASSEAPLVIALTSCSLEKFAEAMQAAGAFDYRIAQRIIDLVGGEASVFERLIAQDDWITEATLEQEEDKFIARARLVAVADELQPEFESHVRYIAMILLQSFQQCEHADVQFVNPGNVPIQVGDHPYGYSRLQRRYVHSQSTTTWTRLRLRFVASALSKISRTQRTSIAIELIKQAEEVLDVILRIWLCVERRAQAIERMHQNLQHLQNEANKLVLPFEQIEIVPIALSDAGDPFDLPSDSLHQLLTGIRNVQGRLTNIGQYGALAAFIRDTLIPACVETEKTESWSLLGESGPPQALQRIRHLLSQLHAIVAEISQDNTAVRRIVAAARSGPTRTYLERATASARRQGASQLERVPGMIQSRLQQRGISANVLSRQSRDPKAILWLEAALLPEISDLSDLDTVLKICFEVLDETTAETNVAIEALIAPCWESRPIRRFAHHHIRKPIPMAFDLFDTWNDEIQEPLSTPVTDATDQAFTALRALSAIGYIANCRPEDTRYQAYVDEMSSRFESQFGVIRDAQGNAEITQNLSEILAQAARVVESEYNSDDGEPGYFSMELARGSVDEPTSIWTAYLSALNMALVLDFNLGPIDSSSPAS